MPDSSFTDVPDDLEADVNCVAAYEVTAGTSPTTFDPTGTVSRAQMASFMMNVLDRTIGYTRPANAPDAFADDDGIVHEDNINDAAAEGIVSGVTEDVNGDGEMNDYNPSGQVTRGQMATFLVNTMEAAGVDIPNTVPDHDFDDVEGNAHADNIAIIADNAGLDLADGTSTTTYGPNDPVSRGQMARFLARGLDLLVEEELVQPIPDEIGPNETFTDAPELVSVEKAGGDIVRFNFDQPIPGIEALPNMFRLYDPAGNYTEASATSISGSTVIARFPAAAVASAVRAGSRTNAVESGTGLPSIAGGYALSATAQQIPALDPQLVSVGNYRFSDEIALGVNQVLVDFVFAGDDARAVVDAAVAGADPTVFSLVGNNGQLFPGTGFGPITEDDDQVVITVAFANDPTVVPQVQLRRGVFVAEDLGGGGADDVVLSASFGATNGTTVDPDLVSVVREGTNIFRFQFDEAVSAAPGDIVAGNFFVVNSAGQITPGTTASRLADANANTVRVQFGALTSEQAATQVHGFVLEDSVLATDVATSDNAGQNRAAGRSITVPVVGNPTPGVTALPDLTGALRIRDAVTGQFSLVLIFDQDIPASVIVGGLLDTTRVDVRLYDANGVEFTPGVVVTSSFALAPDSLQDNMLAVSAQAGSPTSDQIEATVTASVQTTDVTEDPALFTEGQANATPIIEQ